MRVLVTFAVEAEFAPWRKLHNFRRELVNVQNFSTNHTDCEVYEASVFGVDVDVFLTGIGWESKAKHFTRRALRALLRRKPQLVLSTGLAGGLNRGYQAGQVIAATELVQRSGGPSLYSSNKFLRIARDCGATVGQTLITERHIVSEARAKTAMSKFGDFVDMESYHILSMVSGTQVPSLAVRAISDAADDSLPLDFGRVLTREGGIRLARLTKELLAHPFKIPALVAFGQQSAKAAQSLAEFLDRFVRAVSGQDVDRMAGKQNEVMAS